MVDYTKALTQFQLLRSAGLERESAMSKTCTWLGLDYDADEDTICDVKAFLNLNDVVRDFEE